MTYWQVRAEFGRGQLVFGVRTDRGEPAALQMAGQRLTVFGQRAEKVIVTRIPPPGERPLPSGG